MDGSLYFVLGLILLIILLILFKRKRKPESIYEEERRNQNSNHRIILCPDCSQKIRFSVPLTAEIIKCQKCHIRLSVRVDEDGHVYVTSQDKKQKDHSESESGALVDYFEVLGLSIEAAPDEIRSAYKKKIKEYHPDKVSKFGEKIRVVAEKEAKKINNAYFTLKELGYA
ncbi:J domain-containing protein [Colwellia sp. BRX8-9]|nr:J domain-containing protein [Colwellia sp. BRX8-9]